MAKGLSDAQQVKQNVYYQESSIRNIPLFSLLEEEALKAIAGQMTMRMYKKGERLLTQGDTPQSFAVIMKGCAKVFTVTEDGREKILSILGKNDYFGEMYLFGSRQADCSVEALERVRVGLLLKPDFINMISVYPDMAFRLMSSLSHRVIQLENILKNALSGRADQRIASLLLELNKKCAVSSPEGEEIVLPLSREGMANYLGIARETVSRKLNRMETDGILKCCGNKRMRLLKPGLLAQIAMGNENQPI